MKKTKLRLQGHSTISELKRDIQALVREIVILRDKGCILQKVRHCGDPVMQADHLITRSNSATYADTRLIVCLCRSCHGWKHWHEHEYDALVKTLLPKRIVKLWEQCEQDRYKGHYKPDWSLEKLALEKELAKISKVC